MKRVKLTQGQFATVDNEDYPEISCHKWYAAWSLCTKSFYAVRGSNRKNGKRHGISMAREVLGLKFGDKRQADHRNHDTLRNCRSNLRIVTHQQNVWNRKNPKGYYWQKVAKKYHALIQVNNKKIYLGLFDVAEDARNAYLKAKEKYHRVCEVK